MMTPISNPAAKSLFHTVYSREGTSSAYLATSAAVTSLGVSRTSKTNFAGRSRVPLAVAAIFVVVALGVGVGLVAVV